MHRILVGCKDRKRVITDRALKGVQVHTWAFSLDTDKHHRSFAPRTRRALKWDRWKIGRRVLRLGHRGSLSEAGAQHSQSPANARTRYGDDISIHRSDLNRESIKME
jgi:hypothetical protein